MSEQEALWGRYGVDGPPPVESDFEEISHFDLLDQLPVSHLSPSSIATLFNCPEQFRRKYIKGEWDKPGPWGAQGSTFHDTRHDYLRTLMDENRHLSEDEWGKAFNRHFGRYADEAKLTGTQRTDIYVSAKAITAAYLKVVAPDLPRPVSIEAWCSFFLPDVPLKILGRTDFQTEEAVIDTKTGRQGAKKPKPEWIIQGLIYLRATGRDRFEWHTLASGKTGVSLNTPATSPDLVLHARRSRMETAEAIARHAYQDLVAYLERYGPDDHWPGHGVAKGGCSYCSFRQSCPFYVF